jgi:peptidoglycan hydrolase CwlO-like protein
LYKGEKKGEKMNYELIMIITSQLLNTIIIVIAVITIIANQSKKIDAVSKELTDFKIEVTKEFNLINSKIEQLNSKFDLLNERLNSTNLRIDYVYKHANGSTTQSTEKELFR